VFRSAAIGAVALMGGLLLSACSTGGGSGIGGGVAAEDAACSLIERMQSAGDLVAVADVADPAAFDSALDDAVTDYLSTLDSLAEVVPDRLDGDMEVLRSSVEQYRFDDAVAARAPLDAWSADVCGGPVAG